MGSEIAASVSARKRRAWEEGGGVMHRGIKGKRVRDRETITTVSGMSGVSSLSTASHIKLNQIEHPSPPAHCKLHWGPHWEAMMVWVCMCVCGYVCGTLIPHAACCLTSFSSSVKSFILSIFHCLLTSTYPLSVAGSVFQLAQNLHLVLHNHLHCQTKQHGRNMYAVQCTHTYRLTQFTSVFKQIGHRSRYWLMINICF